MTLGEDEEAEAKSLTRRPLLQYSAPTATSYNSSGTALTGPINDNDNQDITRIIPFFEQENKPLLSSFANRPTEQNELEELSSPKDR